MIYRRRELWKDEKSRIRQKKKKGFYKYFDKKTKQLLIVVAFGAVLLTALSHLGSMGATICAVASICKPFLIGACIAFFLNIPMNFFERHLFSKFKWKRVLSITLSFLTVNGVIGLLLLGIIPQLISSLSTLFNTLPFYLDNLDHFIDSAVMYLNMDQGTINDLYNSFTQGVASFGDWLTDSFPVLLRNIASGLGSSVVSGIVALIASIYMLANKEKMQTQSKRVLYAFSPTRIADKTMGVAKLSNRIFSGFLGGKLLDSLVIGVICFVFMSIMNVLYSFTGIAWFQMSYSLLISMLIGITNIIPYFGPFLGTIPAAFILLLISPPSALLFVIFIVVLQQIDSTYISPKILGKSTGLPALWVFVGTIIGGKLLGILGMLLGVPTAAALYVLASDVVAARLRKKGLDANCAPAAPESCAPAGSPQEESVDEPVAEDVRPSETADDGR